MRYEIRGTVVDSFTGDGIAAVRVEAWDKDFGLDDFLAWAATKSDGSFSMLFDESAFRDIFFDHWPDLYFKVFCYNDLIASTEDSVLWNVRNPEVGVTIEARHPKPPDCDERHIYLKIEPIAHYSPVFLHDHPIAPAEAGEPRG